MSDNLTIKDILGSENLLDLGERTDIFKEAHGLPDNTEVFQYSFDPDLYDRLGKMLDSLLALSQEVYDSILDSQGVSEHTEDSLRKARITKCATSISMGLVAVPWAVGLRILTDMTSDKDEFNTLSAGAWDVADMFAAEIHNHTVRYTDDEAEDVNADTDADTDDDDDGEDSEES